ncbi:MAG: hypothetical protein COA32_05030 [Fluviicola sp.]|nr:MAG: hypothetical protein COA32_05030 [Fluviicola sp.]
MDKFGFLLIFLIAFSSSAQETPFERIDLKVLSSHSEKVAKYSKLELGFALPADLKKAVDDYLHSPRFNRSGINPFVSWDLDVTATFSHRTTGEVHNVDGFYYREMKRNIQGNNWTDENTAYPIRIRFAPPQTGNWTVKVEVKVKGEKKYESEMLTFTAADSDKKGYVEVHENGRYLKRGGKVIVPTGNNIPFPYVNNNLFYSKKKHETLNVDAWVQYRELVKRYALEGGEYFRFFLTPAATDIEFEEVGYYYDRQNFAWEVDQIIELCEQEDVLIDFNMMLHTITMQLGDYYQFRFDYTDNWPDENAWPYKDVNFPSGYSKLLNSKMPSDMFLEEESMKYLKERTRYIIARWGYSTAISMFEILSEPWHVDEDGLNHYVPYDSLGEKGDRARKAAYNYHHSMASYIKDSLNHRNHLLGAVGKFPVGSSAILSHRVYSKDQYIDSTWFDDNIDIISISYYTSHPDKMILSKKGRDNNQCEDGENSYACVIQRLHENYGKPVIFGESDHGDGTHVCSDMQATQIDIMRYAYTKAAGHYVWAGFNYPDDKSGSKQQQDERISWAGIITSKEFYNSDWQTSVYENYGDQGREKSNFQGSDEEIVEHQYIINETKDKVTGYVYNKTFNVYTATGELDAAIDSNSTCFIPTQEYRVPKTITWKPQRLKVEGLKSWKKYRIFFYSYMDGAFLNEVEVRSNLFGKLKLVHPALEADKDKNPLIWYRVEEE